MHENDPRKESRKPLDQRITAALGRIGFKKASQYRPSGEVTGPNGVHPGGKPRLTKEFFDQNPRSANLRNLCIAAIDASEDMVASEGQDPDALERLMDVNHRLMELGIEPEMHVVKTDDPGRNAKRRQLMNDPVMAAEWIAGQVREVFIVTGGFTKGGSIDGVAEHDELGGGAKGYGVVDLQSASPNTLQLMKNVGLIGSMKGFVDYHAGSSEVES